MKINPLVQNCIITNHNKCLQHHILTLRKAHAETLKKIQNLKYQLYILRANESNDNSYLKI